MTITLEDFSEWLYRSVIARELKDPFPYYVAQLFPAAEVTTDQAGYIVNGVRTPWPEWVKDLRS